MNYLDKIKNIFHSNSLISEERVKTAQIKLSCKVSQFPALDVIQELLNCFPRRDMILMSIESMDELCLAINSRENIPESRYNEFIDEIDVDESVEVTIEITKQVKEGHLSVYNYTEFCKELLSLSIVEVLSTFSCLYSEASHLYFDLYSDDLLFKTSTILFSSTSQTVTWALQDRNTRLKKCREVSNFYNQSEYPLLPDDFQIEVNYSENPLSKLFSQLNTILSLVYISSSSSISNSQLYCQINGQRLLEYTSELTDIPTNTEIFNIYHWIFNGGYIVDKALLARNCLSTHCRFSKIDAIDGKALASILSNYDLYLRENVSQYVEMINSMSEYIISTSESVRECISNLFVHFQNNIIAIFSFFLTAFLANVIGGKGTEHVFTHEIVVITYVILAGSALYGAISICETISQKKSIRRQYDRLVEHYSKVLSSEDIDEITTRHKDVKNAERELQNKIWVWAIIWGIFLLVIFLVIDRIGEGPRVVSQIIILLERFLKI